jgi:hypothetical protein
MEEGGNLTVHLMQVLPSSKWVGRHEKTVDLQFACASCPVNHRRFVGFVDDMSPHGYKEKEEEKHRLQTNYMQISV